jgi:SAM-dependent methyltransferase
MQTPFRTRRDCRLCLSQQLEPALTLKPTPPANAFVSEAERNQKQEVFPLELHLCQTCGHLQMLGIVSPEVLFRNYVYVSGTSPVFVDHFRTYAQSLIQFTNLPPGSRVLDIGSNDGTLLKFFKAAGMEVLGIDPARSIAEQASTEGIETLPEFFTLSLAEELREQRGEFAIISANNVFAHADDLHTIVAGVAGLLAPGGIFSFEVSYLLDVLEKTLFDTIYHEHLSYHAVKPLMAFFAGHNMEVLEAIRVDTHGGSIRCIVGKKGGLFAVGASVAERLAEEAEQNLDKLVRYQQFFANIEQRKRELSSLLTRLKGEYRKIVGFGAPAKACTLMHHFELGPDVIDYIIDDSPLKQGLYSPGQHIPVVPSNYLYDSTHRPDYAVLLAWNFANPIMGKHRKFQETGGHFILPLPLVEVY